MIVGKAPEPYSLPSCIFDRPPLQPSYKNQHLRFDDTTRGLRPNTPPQSRLAYLVGGGSPNTTIAKVAGEVLGRTHGT
jgi:hypothetical protein